MRQLLSPSNFFVAGTNQSRRRTGICEGCALGGNAALTAREFLVSKSNTYYVPAKFKCRGSSQIEMSGFDPIFLSFLRFSGLGRRSRPPFPHRFCTDLRNGVVNVGDIERALFLQADERFLGPNFLAAMRARG
jgi:hypothetical protein